MGRPLWIVFAVAACGGGGGAFQAHDAGALDVSVADVGDAGGDTAADDGATDGVERHQGIVLAAPHLRAIYIGQSGVDASPSFDAYLTWLVASQGYWSILAQYGVSDGTFDGSTYVDTDAFFTPGMVVDGLVNWGLFGVRLEQVIHQTGDAGATDGGLPVIPAADGYVVFLPDNVNVDLGGGDDTCAMNGAVAFHADDGDEPYAVVPPCARYGTAISHEVAEMVTDPEPFLGWYSDAQAMTNGGEIADICHAVSYVDGNDVAELWSNADDRCMP